MQGILTAQEGMTGQLGSSAGIEGNLSEESSLTGLLAEQTSLTGELQEDDSITGILQTVSGLTGELTIPRYVGGDEYNGELSVIPDFQTHILETKGKIVPENITVSEIPISITANEAGGLTAYIGG